MSKKYNKLLQYRYTNLLIQQFSIIKLPIFILFLLIHCFFSGCSQVPPDIQISDIVALPSPVMKGVVSVFMRISNKGGKDYLIGAKTDIDDSIVELHDVKDGRMVKVRRVKIPSRGKTEMIPGGLHIMIFNLPDHIMMGDEIRLYLRFEKSGEQVIKLNIPRGKKGGTR